MMSCLGALAPFFCLCKVVHIWLDKPYLFAPSLDSPSFRPTPDNAKLVFVSDDWLVRIAYAIRRVDVNERDGRWHLDYVLTAYDVDGSADDALTLMTWHQSYSKSRHSMYFQRPPVYAVRRNGLRVWDGERWHKVPWAVRDGNGKLSAQAPAIEFWPRRLATTREIGPQTTQWHTRGRHPCATLEPSNAASRSLIPDPLRVPTSLLQSSYSLGGHPGVYLGGRRLAAGAVRGEAAGSDRIAWIMVL